jgi:hypothetical protein
MPLPQHLPVKASVGNDRALSNVVITEDSTSPKAIEIVDTAEASLTRTAALKNEVAAVKAQAPPRMNQHTDALARKRNERSIHSRWFHFTSALSDHWTFEILCCILACACLALIAGIGSRYQNKALSEWPSAISINTIVAVGSAILKDSLRTPIAEGTHSHVAAGNSS